MSLDPEEAGNRDAVLEELLALHAEVDRGAGRLATIHRRRLRCTRGCSDCCVDDLTVFEVEAERIRRRNGDLLRDGRPHPPGACAFLDGDGACRIYEDRPYVCRTQGLPLRWIESGPAGGAEMRDICPLNDATGPPLEELPEQACWTIGPTEGRLAGLQARFAGKGLRRVPLRSLW